MHLSILKKLYEFILCKPPMIRTILSLTALVFVFIAAPEITLASSSAKNDSKIVASIQEFDHTHQTWTSFLKKFVRINGPSSTIDYKAIKNEPKDLQEYVKSLEGLSQDGFSRFSQHERLAFLINAYNAFTVKLIVDNYPVKSIKDISERSLSNPTGSPWKIKFFNFLGEKRHLDNIEHDMIRKQFNEPRIHFAVNCASVGCPALRNEAFVAAQLEKQLEDAALSFISDKIRNRYNPETQQLELSSIFKWYGDDFPKKYESLEAFLAPRITSNLEHQRIIRDKKVHVSYLDYDWSLNEKK